jgi:putative hydrolase of the HAD superfamily
VKYKAVVFDLFGTLIDKFSLRKHREVLGQMASVLSISSDDFAKLWFDTFDMRGFGTFQSLEANIEYICKKLEVNAEEAELNLAAQINREYTVRSMKPRPFATELLSYLKSRGYKTGLVTNCSAEIPLIWANMDLAPLTDTAVFSCSVGIQKPDPRIYLLAAERLAVKAEGCLYIGDGDSQELSGAAAVGMNPVLIHNPEEDSADVHRVDYEAGKWKGPVLSSLKEVLNLVE